jgi:20S proteasome alpha/beta subunit
MRRFMKNGTHNWLERRPEIHQRFRKHKPRPKVTIAIGILSKHKRFPEEKGGQIVLASDSQTTYPGGQKRLDAKKICGVRFADSKILIAQAGSADLADKAIENLKRAAAKIKIENDETIPKAVQSAVREVRDYLVELNRGCNFSDDGWKRFFRDDNFFELLFGYYFESKPHLFSIDIDWCIPIRVKNSFKAIGIGATLGEFLLQEYSEKFPEFEFSELIATDVVEKVIDNVEGCGRPTWVGIARHNEESIAKGLQEYGYADGMVLPDSTKCDVFICRRQLIDAIADELNKQEKKSKPQKSKQLLNTLHSLSKKIGGLVYTDYDDPDGDGGYRMSAYWKNEKDGDRGLKKLTGRSKSQAGKK